MPFGLCNAPATFQRLMDFLLSGLSWDTCLVYLDDILIFAKTHDEMCQRLDDILYCFYEAGNKLRLHKCSFSEPSVVFLGHRISAQGIEPMKTKVTALLDMPAPCNVKDVRAFMGLVSYYRRFVKTCSQITSPLLGLLKKNKIFKWTNEAHKTFKTLRQTLAGAPGRAQAGGTGPGGRAANAAGRGRGAV